MNTRVCSKLCFLVIALVVILGMVLTPGIVHAAPANPDSISLYTARVFQNIFEADDILFIVSYDVGYASEPDEPAVETFRLALYDIDGTTLLIPDRELNYYQYNIHSLYFDAAAAAGSLTWESEYRIRVMGNPIYFEPIEDTTMDTITLSPATHWISGTMATSKTLLKTHCLDLAAILEDEWSLTLIISKAEGQVLNSLGRITFLAAVPGLDSALPDLFQVAIKTLVVDGVAYNGSYEIDTNISAKLGTQVAAAFAGIGTTLNIGSQTAALLWILFIALTIASVVFLGTGNTTASLILVTPVLIIGAYIGAIPLALIFVLATLIVVYMMYHIWLRGT